ncbi:MAG: hypothetical protein WCF85_14410, partial [Rhodospirillaceae bacterium]
MERGTFRAWLAQVDDLIIAQRLELEEILVGRPPRAAVAAVIEADLDAHRGCPHCGHAHKRGGKATKRGLSHGGSSVEIHSTLTRFGSCK